MTNTNRTEAAENSFDEVMHYGNTDVAEMLNAMRKFLGENDMMGGVQKATKGMGINQRSNIH